MDKLPVGQLPDLQQSNNDDEIMVITNSEYNQLKKEKISDFITDLTSTDENNALTKGIDGKMFVTDFGNASNITEGTLPTSVLPEIPLEKIPDIPKDKLPPIETSDLPVSGVSADTYAYPSSVTVNAQGQVTAIEEGTPSGSNADTDLSNITEAGKEVIRQTAGSDYHLTQNQITNCILEVPNNIKIEIQSDGNLVLKAGSTVIIPDGFDEDGARKFVHKTIEQDVVTTNLAEQISNRDFMAIINGTGVPVIGGIEPHMLFAGDTAPTISFQYAYWYDTANNIIKFSSDTGASWLALQYSFPFCHVDITYNTSGSYYNYPKAIFNHCGFIGSVFWADEGIKYLVPNGRNDDGTLNNQIKTTDSIQIHNITTAENLSTATGAKALFFENSINWWGNTTVYTNWNKPSTGTYYRYFNTYENMWKSTSGTNHYNDANCCTFGDLYLNESCQILWFKPYSPLSLSRGANDLKIVDSYSNGTSWYRVWSDGLIEQGGYWVGNPQNYTVEISLLKPYKTWEYHVSLGGHKDGVPNDFTMNRGSNHSQLLPEKFFVIVSFTGSNLGFTWTTSGY